MVLSIMNKHCFKPSKAYKSIYTKQQNTMVLFYVSDTEFLQREDRIFKQETNNIQTWTTYVSINEIVSKSRHHVKMRESWFPEVWILLQPSLKVFIPLSEFTKGDKCFSWIGCHLCLSDGKWGHEVEDIFTHFPGELHERFGGGCVCDGRGGLLRQLSLGLNRDADLS